MTMNIIPSQISLALLVTLSLVGAPVSATKEVAVPLRLKAASQWVVDFKDDSCQLRRIFGEGENKTLIAFSRYAPEDRFRLTLGGAPIKTLSKGKLTLQFGPNEGEQKVGHHSATMADGMFALVIQSGIRLSADPQTTERQAIDSPPLPPLGADREKAVTYLRLEQGKQQPIILNLGAMDKPFAVMQQCVDDMVSNWGIDIEAHKSLQRRAAPVSNPANWVNTEDYPSKMLAEEQSAIVEFRVDIDENGKVTGCHIQASTRPKEFDDAVCGSLVRQGKFKPALDANGKPIRSYWKSTVTFLTPVD